MMYRMTPRAAGLLTVLLLAGALAAPAVAVETKTGDPSRVQLDADPFRVAEEPSRNLIGSGLFGSSRLSLRHSVSYGVTSGNHGSRSSGLWLSEIGYRLAEPLRLRVDVGAVLNPVDGEFLSPRNVYLHGVDLDYRPGDSFQLSFSYRHIPADAAAARWMSRGGVLDDDIFGRPWLPWRRP